MLHLLDAMPCCPARVFPYDKWLTINTHLSCATWEGYSPGLYHVTYNINRCISQNELPFFISCSSSPVLNQVGFGIFPETASTFVDPCAWHQNYSHLWWDFSLICSRQSLIWKSLLAIPSTSQKHVSVISHISSRFLWEMYCFVSTTVGDKECPVSIRSCLVYTIHILIIAACGCAHVHLHFGEGPPFTSICGVILRKWDMLAIRTSRCKSVQARKKKSNTIEASFIVVQKELPPQECIVV